MKILFVASGNSGKVSVLVKAQAESLKKQGIQIDFFLIKGKGIKGYLRNISPLRKYLKLNNYDVIHAHYALCGWVTLLGNYNKLPIIVSYMGSDTYGDYGENGELIVLSLINVILSKLLQPFIDGIIVKSKNLEKYIYYKKKVNLIPNGVDLERFYAADKIEKRIELNLDLTKRIVVFLADKNNKRKNFGLLKSAKQSCVVEYDLLKPFPVEHDNIATYLNAADLFVLTSYNEGSPNVIKEAMACNCPIVATDVGDIRENIEGLEGCYITSFDAKDVAEKIDLALQFEKRTKGRERILELGLDSETVAKKIIAQYKKVLKG